MAKKNLTLHIDEQLLKYARHLAVERDQSLSEWVSTLIAAAIGRETGREGSKRRALKVLNSPLKLDGKALTRDQMHER